MNTCPHCRQAHDSTACPAPPAVGPIPNRPLFRSDYEERDGKMERVTTEDLFVWAAVNKQTGEVEVTDIHPFADDVSNEDLVEAPYAPVEEKDCEW